MTKTIIPEAEFEETLKAWRGTQARIWQYHRSLSRLAIQLYRTTEMEQLYVVGVTCRYICGPVFWDDNNVEVIGASIDGGEPPFTIRDVRAGLLVRCWSIGMARSTMAFDLDVSSEGGAQQEGPDGR